MEIDKEEVYKQWNDAGMLPGFNSKEKNVLYEGQSNFPSILPIAYRMVKQFPDHEFVGGSMDFRPYQIEECRIMF